MCMCVLTVLLRNSKYCYKIQAQAKTTAVINYLID